MIKRIINPHKTDILYLYEPQSIAEYNPAITESPQMLSHKTYMIGFAYTHFNLEEEPCEVTIRILNSTIKDYPELAPEIQERYPSIDFIVESPVVEVDLFNPILTFTD